LGAPGRDAWATKKKSMEIAILRYQVTGLGGAETTLAHLARGLAAAGHRVTVYGATRAPAAQPALGPGIGYVPVPVWGGKAGRLLSYALNTRRLLRQSPSQVVFSLERTLHQQVYRAGDGCHREWLARRAPFLSPGARLAEGLRPLHRVMLFLEKRLFADPGLRRVIANSRQVKAEINRHYGVTPERIRVIYNGLDRQQFRPLEDAALKALRPRLGAPPDSGIVLFVGSGFKRKGLTYLIEAFGSLKDRQSVLWVVGKGNPAPYRRLAGRLGCAGRVRFWGSQAEVASFYQAATVLALPTLYDPCSNVVLEALACGTPVVTTAANGAGEFLTPGLSGEILAQPDDVAGLAQALDVYLERGRDPVKRRAAQEAVAHLSWEATVAQTLAVLEEAAAARGG
jgi:UDP-glucose:(heptosyl)LPS alpha-1,3-glucosyltransferase